MSAPDELEEQLHALLAARDAREAEAAENAENSPDPPPPEASTVTQPLAILYLPLDLKAVLRTLRVFANIYAGASVTVNDDGGLVILSPDAHPAVVVVSAAAVDE